MGTGSKSIAGPDFIRVFPLNRLMFIANRGRAGEMMGADTVLNDESTSILAFAVCVGYGVYAD